MTKVIDIVTSKLLGEVSKEIRKDIDEMLTKLHKKALKTRNPWDDILTAMLCKAFGVKVEE
jgi:hypothetical protein